MSMKFALYVFCDDGSSAVGESSWITGQDKSTFNNNDWIQDKEVLVRWPDAPKDYTKWSNKNGKFPLDPECETTTYAARVLKFNGKIYTNCLEIIV